MGSLFDAATVLRSDGQWTIGYEVDALACGRLIESVDICAGEAGIPTDAGTGFKIEPWAVVGGQKFGTRCSPADAEAALESAMDAASEYEVAHNLWFGDVTDWDSDVNLSDVGVETVAAGTTTADTIAAVLAKSFENHPDVQPVLHLGVASALKLTDATVIDDLNVDLVVSPAYPVMGVAVTGPIIVRLGSIETTKRHATTVNRTYIAATRIVAVEFDPCLAVRAG